MVGPDQVSKESFIQMAVQLGLDTSDAAHMDEVYSHLNETMKTIAGLRKLDLGETEPANTFSPEIE